MKLLTTDEVAEMFHTNASLIRLSRCTGLLYGKPAPVHIRLGNRKILYEQSSIDKYMEDADRCRVTYTPLKK